MNINITGHHLEVTPAIHDYVKSKLERVLHFLDHVSRVHVTLSVDKLNQRAEVTVSLKGKELHADSVEPDLYAAIDALADKLDRQVVKHKEKGSNHAHESQKRQPVE